MTKRTGSLRCAIYTRKSTEEGLEQDFNSLDAQYEACASYIASQRHEGWKLLPKRYDDGGFSGGNVQRPALQALLADIAAGQVDLVVVYKIDRLTRSLTDFVKMVEVFDRHQTSFVSVTQQFNTTTSMGRLTLNVLLSFAQFEREVTGERIRDKIAASKQKGLWMGGTVPLGYDLKDRKLVENAKEAALVRRIFERYLVLGNVIQLRAELRAQRVHSKVRVSRAGNRTGGTPFSRGALYLMLRNRTYRGEVEHSDKVYLGQHPAIVDKSLWDAVQTRLEDNRRDRRHGTRAKVASLLAGMIRTTSGEVLVPTHTQKQGKRYRYYCLRPSETQARDQEPLNLPAHDLEQGVETTWCALLEAKDLDRQLATKESRRVRDAGCKQARAWADRSLSDKREVLLDLGMAITLSADTLTLSVPQDRLRHWLLDEPLPPTDSTHRTGECITKLTPLSQQRLRGESRILGVDAESDTASTALLREQFLAKIALGRKWGQDLINGEVDSLKSLSEREGHAESYLYDVIRVGCLAPTLIQALLDGKPLKQMGLEAFKSGLPLAWNKQVQQLAIA